MKPWKINLKPMSNKTSINLGELREEVEEELEYGDSLSSWVRGAIRLRLDLENSEEVIDDPDPFESEA